MTAHSDAGYLCPSHPRKSYPHPRSRKPDLSTSASRYAYATFHLRTGAELSTPRSKYEEEEWSRPPDPYLKDGDDPLLHYEHVQNLVDLMRKFGIPNPRFFLEEFTRSEIYTVLEKMAVLEIHEYHFRKPGGFLYTELEKRFR